MPQTKKSDKAKPGSFVIAETATSTWSYHLRRVGEDGKLYLSGGAPPALCGRALGWDVKFPVEAWGKKTHLNEKWCLECAQAANDDLVRSSVLPALDIASKGVTVEGWLSTTGYQKLRVAGRPLYKNAAEAARHAGKDLADWECTSLKPGSVFYVGEASRSSTFASGSFTEVWVVGRLVMYEIGKSGRPRQQRRPRSR